MVKKGNDGVPADPGDAAPAIGDDPDPLLDIDGGPELDDDDDDHDDEFEQGFFDTVMAAADIPGGSVELRRWRERLNEATTYE